MRHLTDEQRAPVDQRELYAQLCGLLYIAMRILSGFPIAMGERRHLSLPGQRSDELTGTRWSLEEAEAVPACRRWGLCALRSPFSMQDKRSPEKGLG